MSTLQEASLPRVFKLFRALGLRHLVVVDNHNQVSSHRGQRAPVPPVPPALAARAQLLPASSGPCAYFRVSSKVLLPLMLPEVRWGHWIPMTWLCSHR